MPFILTLASSCLLSLSVASIDDSSSGANDWPGWRGLNGTGVAAGAPPVSWKEGENIRWRAAIPGKGVSSPIVSGGLVIVTTAVPTGQPATPDQTDESEADEDRGGQGWRGRFGGFGRSQPLVEQEFVVMALDRQDGSVVWQATPHKQLPHQNTHGDGSFATPTPVTDGETIFASFGSFGIYAYSMEGEELWRADLGDLDIQASFGEGASPTLADEFLIINWDHEGDSFITVLDKENGEEIWRRERDSGTSWSTPIVAEVDGEKQIVVTASRTIAYELEFGDIIWEMEDDGGSGSSGGGSSGGGSSGGGFGRGGMRSGVMSSPVYAEGLVHFSTGDRGGAMSAVRLEDADGDLAQGDAIAWSETRDLPRIPSPIVYDGMLYALKANSGMLSAFDAATGERAYGPERLQGIQAAYASPVAAGGHLYFTGRDGTVEVVKAGAEFKSVAVNAMSEGIDASPAVADDELYLRSASHLYCIAKD